MYESLALLLMIATFSGWWVGRYGRSLLKQVTSSQDPVYFRGLNYLLNEQPDKAIDLFIELLEVNAETVETHLALGGLFRRRGEVERAIRIHQNLMAHPALDQKQRALALLELGQDYMRAGLFDRAESLLNELVNMGVHLEQALLQLKEIYQQEKDWARCLEVAHQLERVSGQSQGIDSAHYYCEQAEEALRIYHLDSAWSFTNQALQMDPNCVRATLLRAEIERKRCHYGAAIRCYRQAIEQDIGFFPEALPGLVRCCNQLGEQQNLVAYLRDLYSKHHDTRTLIALADLLGETSDNAMTEVEKLLGAHLRQRVDLLALKYFIALVIKRRFTNESNSRQLDTFKILQQALHHLTKDQPAYLCARCGFTARQMHWQCPGCKGWGTVRHAPVDGIDKTGDPRCCLQTPSLEL